MNPNFDGFKVGTKGHASTLVWGKILRERDKFVYTGETSVWCDAVDCSWGCALVFTAS